MVNVVAKWSAWDPSSSNDTDITWNLVYGNAATYSAVGRVDIDAFVTS